MPVPLAPYILGRDPPICCHKLEYMFAPFGPAGGWGYAPLDDWAQGPVPGYVPSSSADRASLSTGPTAGDDVDDGSVGRFDDDSL